jgi:hypothetical protein
LLSVTLKKSEISDVAVVADVSGVRVNGKT